MRVPTILLIRDDDATHDALRRRLEGRGCRVLEARGQDEAVWMAARLEPDLLVQEDPLPSPRAPGALDAVMAAIEILAGPLPGRPRAGWPSPRRTHPRARHRAMAGAA